MTLRRTTPLPRTARPMARSALPSRSGPIRKKKRKVSEQCQRENAEELDAYRAALLADVREAVEAIPTFTVTGGEYRVIRYVDREAIGAVLDAMARGA